MDPTPQELRDAQALVERHLGFRDLRPGQAETIARVRRGEDVLAILPTGGGKSVCYQLPAVLGKRVTLVVSPLVALMKDQLDSLPPPMRAAATALTGRLSAREQREVLEEIARGRYRLVYAAPERLRQSSFLQALRSAGLERLVIDEAHCLSVWGHDFRPDYLNLPAARRALGQPPLLAVTATAAPRVLDDIQARLGPLAVVRASVVRPNLRLEAIVAKDADEKLAHLLRLCRETQGPGVVYCSSQVKTEQIAAALGREGFRALAYHAGLPDRAERQDAFMRGEVDLMVATIAFGMGVDKQDLRYVVHHDPSSSLEAYVQEAGRAGRDGAPARCVLLATSADGATLRTRAKGDLPSLALVEDVWRLALAGRGTGRAEVASVSSAEASDEDGLALVDLEQLEALDRDEVRPRVALSVLQEAGAVVRLADVPRFVDDESVFDVAQRLGVAPQDVEATLLDRGMGFRAEARAALVRVVGRPERAEDVLALYAQRAGERAEEVMRYARDTGCRHAHLARYLGEDAPDRCANCDNCLGLVHAAPEAVGDEESDARAVLLALSGVRGLGEQNLVLMLRGDPLAPPWTDGRPGAGALGFRSASKVKALIAKLERRGLVLRETLANGGVALKLAPAGAQALASEGKLLPEPAASRGDPGARRPSAEGLADRGSAREGGSAADDPLFQRLRAWRKEVADAEGVPPYVVAHDAMLRALVEARPRSREELRAVKGFGAKKVERYGDALLALLAEAA